jgi:hypothetical protein
MIRHLDHRVLQRHLDGDLPTAERWEIESHLSGCEECRREYEALESLLEQLTSLPGAIPPPIDLWPVVAKRIRHEPRLGVDHPSIRNVDVRATLLLRWLVPMAAALLLVVGISRLREPSIAPVTSSIPDIAQPTASTSTDALAGWPVSEEARGYENAIRQMQTVLATQKEQLRPETVEIVERNLRIIDAAIAEAGTALANDPGNELLRRHLANQLRIKLSVLQTVSGALNSDI